ncbi:MMPL family transporter [Saccharopolyspora sp. NPDC050389]|uniref:MMPL family transporter n=1 Tax=Saccharopolyspora sp. NPDC050389 TaxID=3155516 RepID=UPI0034108107
MGKSRTVRVARWSAAHPVRALISWFVFVGLCLGMGALAGTNSATVEDHWVGEAGRADAIAASGGLQRKPIEQIIISARSGQLDQARAAAVAAEVASRMRALPAVETVAPPVRSGDGAMLLVEVTMKGPDEAADKQIDSLLAQTEQVQQRHPALLVEETGNVSSGVGVDQQRSDDLALSEAITLPVTLITLLVVFGSVLMAGVPLLLALSSIAAAMGLSTLVSHVVPDVGVGNNIILLIGMAVGVDYALFYLKREREERERGGRLDSAAIVGLAAETAGRTVVVSGIAVIVSTATLYLAADVIFSSLATGTITVVLVSVVSSLTALPALLVILGRRAERRAKPAKPKKVRSGRIWDAMLRPAAKRPVLTLCVSSGILLLLSLPLLGMQMRVLNKDSHSREIPVMRTYDRMTAAFPELRTRHDVVVRAKPADAEKVRAALVDLGRRVQGDPLFMPSAPPQTSWDGRVSMLQLSVPFKTSSEQAARSLTHLRSDYVPATVGALPGVEAVVSGDVAHDVDYLAHQNSKLPLVITALLLLTFVVSVVVFRSVVIGLVGVALNLLSAAASMGLLVIFFQYGLASTLFGFDPSATSAIGSRVPLFLFVILFGLSMDYQMFVVSRIREAALRGVPTRQAVLQGVEQSAKVVTSAAIVMVTVFATFMFLHLAEMKQIGFSLAVAVLLDAFVIRVLILPAALTLLGRASWWPSRLMRRTEPETIPARPAPVG